MPRGLQMSEVELDLAGKIFRFYDKDKSGALDASELGPFLRDLAEDLSDEQVAVILKEVDTDNSGTVDFQEFLVYWQSDPSAKDSGDAEETAVNTDAAPGDDAGSDSDEGGEADRKHIFIAFDPSQGGERVKKLIDSLTESGYRLYTPTSKNDSVNEIIADGVENASAVIVLPTEQFQNDRNAAKALNYADQRKVRLFQCDNPDFQATGWLGAILAPTPTVEPEAEDCVRVLSEKNVDVEALKLVEGEVVDHHHHDDHALFHGSTEDGSIESYYYFGDEQYKVDLEFLMLKHGRVIGQGTDAVGDFSIAGTFELAGRAGTISFAKEYIGAHVVDYEGRLQVSEDNKILGMGGVWSIDGGNSGRDRFTMMMALSPEAIAKIEKQNAPRWAGTGTKVMISYAPSQYDLAVVVAAELSALGLKVIVPSLKGSAAMRCLIKDAAVVVPLMSQDYQDSPKAQKILTYADANKIPIVPAMAQSGWSQSGWLGVICAGALWTDVTPSDEEQLRNNIKGLHKEVEVHVNPNASAADDDDDEPHVMLSYQWGSQELVKRVAGVLKDKALPIWFDIEGDMSGNINKAMASGVENAVVLVAFTSNAYEKSANCQKELTYASQLSKNIIPVYVDDAVEANTDTWMAKIAKACDGISLKSDSEEFDAAMDALVQRVSTVLQGVSSEDKSNAPPTVFEGGPVDGFYKYQASAGLTEDKMSFEFFRLVKGRVSGQGQDPVGPFVMAGKYTKKEGGDDNAYDIQFAKQYVGKHLVEYTGTLRALSGGDKHFEVEGRWEIPGDWSGEFGLEG